MPKVYISKTEKTRDLLIALIFGKMKTNGITQAALANKLGITQTGMSAKLKRQNFRYEELIDIFETLGFTDQQILAVMKKGDL